MTALSKNPTSRTTSQHPKNKSNEKNRKGPTHHQPPRKNKTKKEATPTTTTTTTTTTTSTRVCIKNVPPSFTSLQLRDFLTREYQTRSRHGKDHQHDDNNDNNTNKLVITDCRVLMHPTKKISRRMAFCGFQTTEMAQRVIQLFDQTFALTSRLTVEPAYAAATTTAEQTKPSHQNESKQHDTNTTTLTLKEKGKKNTQDNNSPETEATKPAENSTTKALLELGSHKAKFWSNDFTIDDGVAATNNQENGSSIQNRDDVEKKDGDGDDDASSTTSHGSSSSVNSDSSDDHADPLLKNSSKSKPNQMSDLDFLKSKQKMVDDLDDAIEEIEDKKNDDKQEESGGDDSDSDNDDDDDDDDDDNDDSQHSTQTASKDRKAMDVDIDIQASDNNAKEKDKSQDLDDEEDEDKHDTSKNRLFVRNLPFTTTEEDLEEQFAVFGSVTECHIPVDDRKMSKGFAFVTFESGQEAERALEALDGTDFQGRFLHVMLSRQKPQENDNHNGDENNNNNYDRPLSYKERQELARRQQATKSSQGWSASFVRGDAVVDSLADRLGLKKGDILNVKEGLSSGDAAVRLALGETQIIEENRAYFQNHGIDMEALVSAKKPADSIEEGDRSNVKRSKTSLLVKNLPYDTQVEELTKVFHGVGGAPKRILLPPSRTIALVEYDHGSDAKRAFRKLAYRRFKSVPLYLEWAPLGARMDAPDNSGDDKNISTTEAVREPLSSSKEVLEITVPEEEDVDAALDGPTPSIYIKNLNFSTTEDRLRDVFDKAVGDVRAVRIPKKLAPISKARIGQSDDNNKEQMQSLSMGFGFIEFASHEAARKALSKLQGTIVDGHALELKPSTKSLTTNPQSVKLLSVANAKNKNPTKVMVRNVPFQATRTELLKLFGSFGQLKRVRLPKKFDGGHRGFAFVEFVTHKEAVAAMKSLSRTHLYGRHLVIEWAEDLTEDPERGLDALRDKAQKDILHHRGGGVGNSQKRQRLS